jgi:hypothetical protein
VPFVQPPPQLSADELLAVPETLAVDARRFRIYTSLARNFMPMIPPDGAPLAGIVVVTALDSLPIANAISSDALWIVYQRQVWSSWFSSPSVPSDPSHPSDLTYAFSGGPQWGPNVFVDVVIRIVDRRGNMHLLRGSKQKIGRLD